MSNSIKVGNTPLKELKEIEKRFGLSCHLFAKLESFNPAGSVKDRVALKMIEAYEESGKASKDTVFVEPTSGNTGIGIAYMARAKGYKAIIVMPDSMSVERRQMIAQYGAELVLTPGANGMKGAIAKANELVELNPNYVILGQFDNPNNVRAHYEGTGPEIFKQLDGKVDAFVAGVGTGGTVTGVGKFLKEKNPSTKVVAVEPLSSPVLSKGVSGPHKIQGIGAGFIPSILDTSIYDEIIDVSNEDAFLYGKMLIELEGLSIGISSGAAFAAALEVAKREEAKDKNIVVLLPDGGDRYQSTDLYK